MTVYYHTHAIFFKESGLEDEAIEHWEKSSGTNGKCDISVREIA
jgi:hypothetical protein